jgi:hypothetical protein
MSLKINFSVLCSRVLNCAGKVSLIDIFNSIQSKTFPATHPELFVFIDGEYSKSAHSDTYQVKLFDDKNQVISASAAGVVELKDKSKIGLVLQLAIIKFEREGKYRVAVYENDKVLVEHELKLELV